MIVFFQNFRTLNQFILEKDSEYYDSERSELLELVPLNAINILDIGCGNGKFGRLIKKRQECQVYGIELNKEAAEEALKNIDFIYQGSVNDSLKNLKENFFDCIIMADVLEHLLNPFDLLIELKKYLNESGLFLISIPNFCHYMVFEKIIFNEFKYYKSGILDNTHINFFSKEKLINFLIKQGFFIDSFSSAKSNDQINGEIINIFKQYDIPTDSFISQANDLQYFFNAVKSKEYVLKNIFDLAFNYLKYHTENLPHFISYLEVNILNQASKSDLIKSLYCSAILHISLKMYEKSLTNLQELLKIEGLNLENGSLFEYVLVNKNDFKTADIFKHKKLSLQKHSEFKNEIKILFDLLTGNLH